MKKYTVTFLPDRKRVRVDAGTTLLEAAEKAGLSVASLCGGQGLCGECRLQVTGGEARPDKHAIGFLTPEEVQSGYVLACQTRVKDDIEVFIPARSRQGEEVILTEGIPIDYSQPETVSLHRRPYDPLSFFGPLVAKIYLELPEPTTGDNISDIDRIIRELGKKVSYSSFEVTLACLQGLAGVLRQYDWKVTASVARYGERGCILEVEGGDTTERNYGLAVDVGTTTVVVQLLHLKTGKVVGVEGSLNRQTRYGGDVISRMIFACTRGNLDSLHGAVVKNINALTQSVAKKKKVNLNDITCVLAAGNTTMSHFLLNLMPCSIRLDPYVPTASRYPQILAGDIGINVNPRAPLVVMPSVASYVGGDMVAGVLACGLADKPEVKCLIDVGTNGEIAIGNNEWIVCCSASAGPAFEGAGTKWGMRAARGAIEEMEIKDGQVIYRTIGRARPRGICGAGLVECLYEMVRNKIISRDGKFNVSPDDKRLVTDGNEPEYVLAFAGETESGQAITITQSDISNLMKAKGAVFAAIKSLADYIGMSLGELDTIYLAGGFGSSLDIGKAVAIGMLPDVDVKRIQFIGNSSIMGARMALLSGHALEGAADIARKMTNIELSSYPPFMNEFVAALFLPHTHAGLFPSVRY